MRYGLFGVKVKVLDIVTWMMCEAAEPRAHFIFSLFLLLSFPYLISCATATFYKLYKKGFFKINFFIVVKFCGKTIMK